MAFCVMRHSCLLLQAFIHCGRLHHGSCVASVIGSLYGHCTLVLERQTQLRMAEVGANHSSWRSLLMLPNMFLLPLVFRFNSKATPRQMRRAHRRSKDATLRGKPCLHKPPFLVRFVLGVQYGRGLRSPFSSRSCQ